MVRALLDWLTSRKTIILREPLVKSFRRRYGAKTEEVTFTFSLPMTQKVSPEEAVEFLKHWARNLAIGWVDRFFKDLPKEEKESMVKKLTEEIIKASTEKLRMAAV